jgi:hypothetical protein
MSPRIITTKSAIRTRIVDTILEALSHEDIYRTIDYKRQRESAIKQYMHRYLKDAVREVIKELNPTLGPRGMARRIENAVLWESDKTTTIGHVSVLGTPHRPDFRVDIGGLKYAVEVKRGESGASIREGIGQSIMYAMSYDFVAYVFIDTGTPGRIKDAYTRALEGDSKEADALFLIGKLWDDFNVKFVVV